MAGLLFFLMVVVGIFLGVVAFMMVVAFFLFFKGRWRFWRWWSLQAMVIFGGGGGGFEGHGLWRVVFIRVTFFLG